MGVRKRQSQAEVDDRSYPPQLLGDPTMHHYLKKLNFFGLASPIFGFGFVLEINWVWEINIALKAIRTSYQNCQLNRGDE